MRRYIPSKEDPIETFGTHSSGSNTPGSAAAAPSYPPPNTGFLPPHLSSPVEASVCLLWSSPLTYRLSSTSVIPIEPVNVTADMQRVTDVLNSSGFQICFQSNFASLQNFKDACKFSIIHFAGLCMLDVLALEEAKGEVVLLNARAIRFLDGKAGHKIGAKLIVLATPAASNAKSACDILLENGAENVLIVRLSDAQEEDGTLRAFYKGLYEALLKGVTVQKAFELGQTAAAVYLGLSASEADGVSKFTLFSRTSKYMGRSRLSTRITEQVYDHSTLAFRAALAGPSIDLSFPPAPAQLPPPAMHFVGRGALVSHVCALLTAYRLLTLQGPAGIGKSAVALASAHWLHTHNRFARGVTWIPCLGLRTAAALRCLLSLYLLQHPLDVDDDSATDAFTDLRTEAYERLLVLDNCGLLVEQDAKAFAKYLQEVLHKDGSVRILLTCQHGLADNWPEDRASGGVLERVVTVARLPRGLDSLLLKIVRQRKRALLSAMNVLPIAERRRRITDVPPAPPIYVTAQGMLLTDTDSVLKSKIPELVHLLAGHPMACHLACAFESQVSHEELLSVLSDERLGGGATALSAKSGVGLAIREEQKYCALLLSVLTQAAIGALSESARRLFAVLALQPSGAVIKDLGTVGDSDLLAPLWEELLAFRLLQQCNPVFNWSVDSFLSVNFPLHADQRWAVVSPLFAAAEHCFELRPEAAPTAYTFFSYFSTVLASLEAQAFGTEQEAAREELQALCATLWGCFDGGWAACLPEGDGTLLTALMAQQLAVLLMLAFPARTVKANDERVAAAILLCQQAVAVFSKLQQSLMLGVAQSALAWMHLKARQLSQAYTMYGHALDSYRIAHVPEGEAHCVNSLARLALWMGDPRTASSYFESCLTFARKQGQLDRELEAMYHLGFLHLHAGRMAESQDMAMRLQSKAQSEQNQRLCVGAHSLLCCWYSVSGSHTQALTHAHSSLGHSQKLEWSLGVARSHVAVARVFLEAASFKNAFESLDVARKAFDSENDALGKTEVICLQGYLNLCIGRISDAGEKLNKAATAFEKLQYPVGSTVTLYYIALFHKAVGNLEVARRTAAQAAVLFEAADMAWGRVQAHTLVGEVEILLGNYAMAREMFEKALELGTRTGQVAACAHARKWLGQLTFDGGAVDKGEELLEEALSAFVELQNTLAQAECLMMIGSMEIQQFKVHSGDHKLVTALRTMEGLHDVAGQAQCLLHIARSHIAQKNAPEADKVLRRASDIVENLGSPILRAELSCALAELEFIREGDPVVHAKRAMRQAQEIDYRRVKGQAQLVLARVALRQNETEKALELFSTVCGLYTEIGCALALAHAKKLFVIFTDQVQDLPAKTKQDNETPSLTSKSSSAKLNGRSPNKNRKLKKASVVG